MEMKSVWGMFPYMDKTLASSYLQLVRALLKLDLVTLIDANEVREHPCVFLVEKPGKDTQRLIIDARVSNMHFFASARSKLGNFRELESCRSGTEQR